MSVHTFRQRNALERANQRWHAPTHAQLQRAPRIRHVYLRDRLTAWLWRVHDGWGPFWCVLIGGVLGFTGVLALQLLLAGAP